MTKVTIKKVEKNKWDVRVSGEVIGQAKKVLGDSYEIKLPNRKIITAINQEALKRMVAKHI